MNERELDFVLGEFGVEFLGQIDKVAKKDGFVLGAWVEERRGVLFVAVELIIGG